MPPDGMGKKGNKSNEVIGSEEWRRKMKLNHRKI